MNNKELLDLATDIEALTEGSREMDARIGLSSGWKPRLTKSQIKHGFTYEQDSVEKGTFELTSRDGIPCGKCKYVPKYTSSLDSAYSLIPEGWFFRYCSLHEGDVWKFRIADNQRLATVGLHANSTAKTHCGAIIAASLRAIASDLK